MIVYNVTINIEDEVHLRWLTWMLEEHIPQVMETGLFVEYKMMKLLSRQDDETGQTYAIQYYCRSQEQYDEYQLNHAPRLQAETRKHFEGKFVAFRTLLEMVQ